MIAGEVLDEDDGRQRALAHGVTRRSEAGYLSRLSYCFCARKGRHQTLSPDMTRWQVMPGAQFPYHSLFSSRPEAAVLVAGSGALWITAKIPATASSVRIAGVLGSRDQKIRRRILLNLQWHSDPRSPSTRRKCDYPVEGIVLPEQWRLQKTTSYTVSQ